MSKTHGHPSDANYERLRTSARDLIDHGVPPPTRGGNLNADALKLLYERASRPESAPEALKLLHELQTYQVELDLLYEQLQANELELNEELTHYKWLYEEAPVAYLVVAKDGEIIEGNRAAGVLLGKPHQMLMGQHLCSFVASGQEGVVSKLLGRSADKLSGSGNAANSSVELPDHRQLKIVAKPDAAQDSILVILTEATTQPASF